MAITITYVPGDEFITVTCRGKVTFEDVKAVNEEGVRLAVRHGVFKFLADSREVDEPMEPYEIYDLPGYYGATGVPRSAMIAVVAPEGRRSHEDYRFFETVCRNNGYGYVETFESLEDAKAWLTGKTPPAGRP